MRASFACLLLLGISACGSPEPTAQAEPAPSAPSVAFERHDDTIEVTVDGKPLTTFYFGAEEPKPYLHPIRAADGTIVSRAYPMSEDVEGEAHDHPHHRGMWFTHGDVNGYDYWANELSYTERTHKGKVVLKGIHESDESFIRADFDWLSPDGDVVLTEDRTMHFAVAGDNVVMDFDVTLEAAVKPVKFGDTKEGFFAIRLAHTMREKLPDKSPGTGVIENASGAKGAKNTWGKPSPWVDYSGPVGGKTYGVAIFDHPENPKHPTYWHVRDYGLFAANAFGEHDFFADESRDGSMTIEPGESLRFRYRVVIHPGDAAAADVAGLYGAWQ